MQAEASVLKGGLGKVRAKLDTRDDGPRLAMFDKSVIAERGSEWLRTAR